MRKNNILTTLLYAICGFLCALPFIVNDLWFLTWIAYIPILINEWKREEDKEKPYKKAWLRGLAFFFPFGVTTFYWIVELYPMDFVGFTPFVAFIVVTMGITLLPLFQALFTSFNIVFLCFLKRNRVKQWMYPLAAGAMWIFQEWLQTLTWAGVPWSKLAIGQVHVLQNIQSASLFGSYFVSFIIITTAGYLAMFLINFKQKDTRKRAMIFASVALIIFSSNFAYGLINLNFKSTPTSEFTAAAVQGNIQTESKWGEDMYGSMDVHKNLLIQAANDGADLVVFAETAFPFDIKYDFIEEYINDMSSQSQVDFIMGCFTHDGPEGYNSTVLVTKDNGITDEVYIKQKLVPFGEFVPMKSIINTVLPFMSEMSQLGGELIPGTDSVVFDTRYGKVGSLICFDSIYETVALDSVNNGAEILAISTNDSWFHDSAATYQHTAAARLRAIELDRYIIRSGNTGISAIINNKGEIIKKLDVLQEGYVLDTVKTYNTRTLYSCVGNIIILAAFIFMIILSIRLRIKTKKIKDREERARSINAFNEARYGNSYKKSKKK